MFQVCFNEVSGVCHKYIKVVSGVSLKVFEGSSKRISKQPLGSFRIRKFRTISRFFQEYFKEVSRKCCENLLGIFKKVPRCFKEASRVFQGRDGILHKRREHARGRNLADCGRICGSARKSVGSIEEMWQKYSK